MDRDGKTNSVPLRAVVRDPSVVGDSKRQRSQNDGDVNRRIAPGRDRLRDYIARAIRRIVADLYFARSLCCLVPRAGDRDGSLLVVNVFVRFNIGNSYLWKRTDCDCPSLPFFIGVGL